jgi:hypothetical protein
MGLAGTPHHAKASTLTEDCSPLRDTTQYNPDTFAPIKDSITQAKLLLLNRTQLNRALGDILADGQIIKSAADVRTYPPARSEFDPGGNVMVTPLPQPLSPGATPPWLVLIDGDHAWRQDGLPRFCASPPCVLGPRAPGFITTTRITGGSSTGGTGRYPLWESCVLRPAFRALFNDWENFGDNFPDLGDGVSPDLETDHIPPTATATPAAVTTTIEGKPFVLPGTSFKVTGTDAVFTDQLVRVSYRAYVAGTTPGPFQDIANGGMIAMPMDTGGKDWVVETIATDPCAASQPSIQTFGLA